MTMQSALLTARAYGPPSPARAFAAIGTTLRIWRDRTRARDSLAVMNERERNDMPFARDVDIRSEIAKPFWRR